jgi:hypothetical protein
MLFVDERLLKDASFIIMVYVIIREVKDETEEVNAYSGLSKVYYHFSDMEKSSYFHNKALKGEVECNELTKCDS